jgi:hypothetical protein
MSAASAGKRASFAAVGAALGRPWAAGSQAEMDSALAEVGRGLPRCSAAAKTASPVGVPLPSTRKAAMRASMSAVLPGATATSRPPRVDRPASQRAFMSDVLPVGVAGQRHSKGSRAPPTSFAVGALDSAPQEFRTETVEQAGRPSFPPSIPSCRRVEKKTVSL